jgi:hypothetical protein
MANFIQEAKFIILNYYNAFLQTIKHTFKHIFLNKRRFLFFKNFIMHTIDTFFEYYHEDY